MRYFLGLDPGGSKIDAVLIDETGVVHGWGVGGPANYNAPEVVARSYEDALEGALGVWSPAELWVGVVSMDRRVVEWFQARGIGAHFHFTNEFEAGYCAALEDWGLLVLAGTGSFVHARTRDGSELHLGGFGPVLGDEGSAYDAGLRGIRAALRSMWPGARATTLTQAIPAALGWETPWDLVWPFQMRQIGRRDVASLSPVVDEEARGGDAVALEVLREAAAALAEIIGVALDAAGLRGAGCPLIGTGGLAQGSPLYWSMLAEQALRIDATLQPMVPPVRPAVGAAFSAMRAAGVPVTCDLRDRVVETQRAFARAVVALPSV
ncbi:MAG: hypothetical protein N2512_02265 [Armatimonadetes bacterium]|nr:hypothetical protein [Armatimonadota bacterium]